MEMKMVIEGILGVFEESECTVNCVDSAPRRPLPSPRLFSRPVVPSPSPWTTASSTMTSVPPASCLALSGVSVPREESPLSSLLSFTSLPWRARAAGAVEGSCLMNTLQPGTSLVASVIPPPLPPPLPPHAIDFQSEA
jgi:hypothetical protein